MHLKFIIPFKLVNELTSFMLQSHLLPIYQVTALPEVFFLNFCMQLLSRLSELNILVHLTFPDSPIPLFYPHQVTSVGVINKVLLFVISSIVHLFHPSSPCSLVTRKLLVSYTCHFWYLVKVRKNVLHSHKSSQNMVLCVFIFST